MRNFGRDLFAQIEGKIISVRNDTIQISYYFQVSHILLINESFQLSRDLNENSP